MGSIPSGSTMSKRTRKLEKRIARLEGTSIARNEPIVNQIRSVTRQIEDYQGLNNQARQLPAVAPLTYEQLQNHSASQSFFIWQLLRQLNELAAHIEVGKPV